MNKDLINKFIALPMAITVFNQDKDNFSDCRMETLYQDKLDAVVQQMKKDFYKLKSELAKTNTTIRLVDQCKYNVNGEIIEYTPDQLKKMTADIMHGYLFSVDFEDSNRIWPDVDTTKKR